MSQDQAAPGSQLRAARARLALSVQKAADDMRLDAWAIEALESDAYERLGPAVYAKGHLKRYADFLGVPTADVLSGYETLMRAAAGDGAVAANSRARPVPLAAAGPAGAPTGAVGSLAMSVRPDSAGPRRRWWYGAGALAVTLVAAAVIWKPWHRFAPQPAPAADLARNSPARTAAAAVADIAAVAPSAISGASAPATASAPTVRGDAAVAAAPGAAARAAARTVAAAGVAAAGVPAAAGVTAASTAGLGRARLRMSFSADSWVDVHDAAGRRLFSGRGHANTVKRIGGSAPLRVYLGFASGVQLEINEHAVAIGRQFVSGDVARFQAGADGVLRRDAPGGVAPGGAPQGSTQHGHARGDGADGGAARHQFTRNDAPHG